MEQVQRRDSQLLHRPRQNSRRYDANDRFTSERAKMETATEGMGFPKESSS
jgi:hypothetical protein